MRTFIASSRLCLLGGAIVAVALGAALLAGCGKQPGQPEKPADTADERPDYAKTTGEPLDRAPARTARNVLEQKERADQAREKSEWLAKLPDPESLPESAATIDIATLDLAPRDPANPGVVITMESGAEIVLELYPGDAPKTVAQFMKQVEEGYHDGGCFHRADDMCIQGGDPAHMEGRESWPNIPLEVSQLPFTNGSVGLARTNDPDSGNSQFFIIRAEADDVKHLNGQYCNFGNTLKGMDVVYELPEHKLGVSTPIAAAARIARMRLVRFVGGDSGEKASS